MAAAESSRVAFLIGFGLTTLWLWAAVNVLDLVALPFVLVEHWLIAAAIAGVLSPRRWRVAGLGVAGSLAVVILVDAWRVGGYTGELAQLDYTFWVMSMLGAAVVGFAVTGLGSRAAAGRTAPRWLRLAPAGVGAVAFAGVVLTGIAFMLWPAERSFAISVPLGWSRAQGWDWMDTPDVGVSVDGGHEDPEACYRAGYTWAANPAPHYQAPFVRDGRTLAIRASRGFAYEIVREEAAGRVHAFAISHERWVGLVREPVCYVLVIMLPAGSDVGRDEFQQVLDGFRFR